MMSMAKMTMGAGKMPSAMHSAVAPQRAAQPDMGKTRRHVGVGRAKSNSERMSKRIKHPKRRY